LNYNNLKEDKWPPLSKNLKIWLAYRFTRSFTLVGACAIFPFLNQQVLVFLKVFDCIFKTTTYISQQNGKLKQLTTQKMDSTMKAQEGTITSQQEQGTPAKKIKMDSLLLEIGKKNHAKMKELLDNGADVTETGDFTLNAHQTFVGVPLMFAAILSDHDGIIDSLVRKHPHFRVEEKLMEETEDTFILSTNTNVELLIDVCDLVGAACILRGSKRHGWACWREADRLRSLHAIPKTTLNQTNLENLIFGNQKEFLNTQEMNVLRWKKSVYWKIQALFVTRRILEKKQLFPKQVFPAQFLQMPTRRLGNTGVRPVSRFLCIALSYRRHRFEKDTSSWACPPSNNIT
jgi:hypothetical protein